MWMRDYDAAFHPAIVQGWVYFTSNVDDRVRCLSIDDGRLKWEHIVDAPIRTPPTWYRGKLYFGCDDGFLYCLEAATGRRLWRFQPPATKDSEMILHNGRLISRWPCRTGIAVVDGTVYCGFALLPWQPAYLCAIDGETGSSSGEGRFVEQVSGDTFEGPLAVVGATLVACRGRIEPALFDRRSGKRTGKLSGGGGSFLAVDRSGKLWHGPGNKTGWLTRSELPGGKKLRSQAGAELVAFAEDVALFAGNDQVVARTPDGKVRWQASVPEVAALAVVGDMMVSGGRDEVSVRSVEDGAVVWSAKVEGLARGVAVVGNHVVVSTDRGAVVCFAVAEESTGKGSASGDVAARHAAKKEDRGTGRGDSASRNGGAARGAEMSEPVNAWDFRVGMEAFAQRRGLPAGVNYVPDSAGELPGRIIGSRSLWQGAGIEALALDGATYVELSTKLEPPLFPAETLTAEAWVAVDRELKWGGIVGAVRDNGSDERGWLLGFCNQQFCFALNTIDGPGKLTYLKSPRRFTLGKWHHVVGTYDGERQRLFVDGELVAESRRQRGAVRYPPQGWATIGAYRDENEDYRMTGKIDRVAIFDRALTRSEVAGRYRERIKLFPRPVELEAGPWVRFDAPRRAVISWVTAGPERARVRLHRRGGSTIVGDAATSQTEHRVVLEDLLPDEQLEYSIEVSRSDGVEVSGPFPLDLAFNYRLPRIETPSDLEEERRWADRLLEATGFRGGLVAVVGDVRPSRMTALAARPRTFVRQVMAGESVAIERRQLLASQVGYGVRYSVAALPRAAWSRWPRDTANVVIVGSDVELRGDDVTTLCHWVQPGGVLLIAGRGAAPGEEWCRLESQGEEYWSWKRPLPRGVGKWSHIYAGADNTGFGGETLQGVSSIRRLKARWIGLPGPAAQADRTGRKPSPLAVSGLLLVHGLNRVVALDAYNGVIRWELEVPNWARFNMPRDCSNWCADDEFVYLAVRDRCWVIELASGKLVRMDAIPQRGGASHRFAWGYVARAGSKLLGTAVASDAPFREYWGRFGWYDARQGEETAKVCADRLFAVEAGSGNVVWQYDRGVVLQSSLTVEGNHVYFVESRDEAIKQSSRRRLNDDSFWNSLELVCIDLNGGQVVWRRPLDSPPGRVAFLMSADSERVVSVASDDGVFHVRTFDASSGKSLWSATAGWPGGKAGDHGKALARPAIVGDRLFVRPAVFSLKDGKQLPVTLPYGKCGTFSSAKNMFFYRYRIVSGWSPQSQELRGWDRVRPDCWLSTIPALGMVLSPEAGGGCSCGYWFEASLGFSPMGGLVLPTP